MTTAAHLTVVETAQLLRADLKTAFPGVRFSVRSESYALGASIHVAWDGGPSAEAVHAVADRYQRADFDALTDGTTHRPPTELDGALVHFGADHVFCRRRPSRPHPAR